MIQYEKSLRITISRKIFKYMSNFHYLFYRCKCKQTKLALFLQKVKSKLFVFYQECNLGLKVKIAANCIYLLIGNVNVCCSSNSISNSMIVTSQYQITFPIKNFE